MRFFSPKKCLMTANHALKKFSNWMGLTVQDVLFMVLGNMTLAFAIFNIHVPSRITEGGVLGGIVLLNKLFGIDQAIVNIILNFALYFIGIFLLGKSFLKKAIFSTLLYSLFWKFFAYIGPIIPSMEAYPLLAAVVGGLFIGAGCGLVVTRGASSSGDDCLALMLSRYTPLSLSSSYFFSDVTVLILSFVVYLPLKNLLCSIVTTSISSFVIGRFEILHLRKKKEAEEEGTAVFDQA